MICKNCGNDCPKGSTYCPICGSHLEEEVVIDAEVVGQKQQSKCWKVFAKVGKIVGIVTLATSFIPFSFIFTPGAYGIVFSCLGRKALDNESKENASTGLKLSIIGTAISFVYIVFYCCFLRGLFAALY